MADYVRKPQLMIKRGMNVCFPGDRLSPEYFQLVQNARCFKLGEWRQRGGMTDLYDPSPPLGSRIYHINRLNNEIDSTFRRVVGVDNGAGSGDLYVDDSAHTQLDFTDTGYYPTHYSSIISRPDRSPLPYMFIGNEQRNSKISVTGARTEWGISAPTEAPRVDPQGSNVQLLSDVKTTAGWTLTGGSGAALTAASTSNSFLQAVLYDSGVTGMASIVYATASDITFPIVGSFLDITTGGVLERCLVHEARFETAPLPGTAGALIASIAYDSGSTGMCTITFTGVNSGLTRNSILKLNHGGGSAEYVRVLSTTVSLNGAVSARLSTVNTHAAGEVVNGVSSARVYTVNTHFAGDLMNIFAFTGSYTAVAGNVVTLGITGLNTNFTQAPTFAGGSGTTRPLKSDDIFIMSLNALFNVIEEVQVQLDVGAIGFTQDYYYVVLRQSDLIGSITLSQSSIAAQQLEFARRNLDKSIAAQEPGITPPSSIGDLGDLFFEGNDPYFSGPAPADIVPAGSPITVNSNQFQGRVDLRIPLSSFQRVGTGPGTLRNVKGIRLVIKYNGAATSGFNLFAFNFYGSYEPSTLERPNYSYVYRGRNSSTGSRSNPSPPNRTPTESNRRRMNITVTPHPDPQVDVIDVYRTGGTLSDYHLVGTLTNGATVLEDNIPDSVAIRNPILEIDRFKPWVTADVPKSGVVNVVGTKVTYFSGDTFDTGWLKGTQIIIKDKTYTLYTNPSSTTALELNESAETQIQVPYKIVEPALDGRTYPSVFGPFAGAFGEHIFAVGDPRNPGFLYWTNGNDVESTSDINFIELCPPSEKLMTGVVLDGIPYCCSDKRFWRILPSFSGGQTSSGSIFYSQETAIGKGVIGRAAICVGDAIYFVAFDGVYRTRGDAIESLTDDSLAPLFDRDGTFITDFVAPVSPIDFTAPDEVSLSYSFDGIYLTYQGRDGNLYTFFYSFLTRGWILDTIETDEISRSFREIQSLNADNVLVGTTSGKLMIRSNGVFKDDLMNISGRIWDREELFDDLRGTKQVGDVMIDADPDGATMTPTLRYEDNTSSDVLSTLTGNGRDQFVRDVNSGAGRVVRGVALDLTWSDGTAGTPKLYAWEPAALTKAEETVNRASDWDSGGYTGTKWLQGFRLRGDTLGLTKSFQVEIDGGTLVEGFNFTANGEQVVTFWLTNPVVAHEFRIRGTDSDLWRNMGIEWIFEPEPEQAAVWETQVTSFDLPFFSHMREVMIAHRSTTDITMMITTDGVANSYTIPHGSGDRVRTYLPVRAVKAKYHKFRFTSAAPFGLWIRDIECRVGAWGRTDSYSIQRPFGDISRENGGARI